MLSRRDFLKSSGLISLAPVVPGFLATTGRAARAERDDRVLVVIQLDGGNDGINTIVPFADEGYAKYRSSLRLPKERLLKVRDSVGLHPALGAFANRGWTTVYNSRANSANSASSSHRPARL